MQVRPLRRRGCAVEHRSTQLLSDCAIILRKAFGGVFRSDEDLMSSLCPSEAEKSLTLAPVWQRGVSGGFSRALQPRCANAAGLVTSH